MSWLVVGNTAEAREFVKSELFEKKAFGEYQSHFNTLFVFTLQKDGSLLIQHKNSGFTLTLIRRLMSDSMVSAYLKSVCQKSLAVSDFEVRKVK